MKTTRYEHFKNVTFKIVNDTGESREQLAERIAQAIVLQAYYKSQEQAFRTQSEAERKKAQERSNILFQLKEYNRQKKRDLANGIIRKVSRMEPMENYDEGVLTEEKDMLSSRSIELNAKADEFAKLFSEQDEVIAQCREHINTLNE